MSVWSWFSGLFTPGNPWDAANQQNLKLNADLKAYVDRMLAQFKRNGQEAAAVRVPIGTTQTWNSTGRITPLDTYLITLPAYPGFQAQVSTGWYTTSINAEEWADQLLRNARTHEKFYFPAEYPAGHEV